MKSLVFHEARSLIICIIIVSLIIMLYTRDIYKGFWCLSLILFIYFLYRIPDRKSNSSNKEIVSPVDGTILEIKETEKSYEFIFFIHELDPQIQWMPYPGIVTKIEYDGSNISTNWGKYDMYKVANNRRITTTIQTDNGNIILEQIKSLASIHHDIFPEISDQNDKSNHLGYIMFPARIDLIIPKPCRIQSHINEYVKGGETIIASF